ncbi:hypothetical protein ABKN59_011377 [Abortiporus biennis]
MLFIHFRCLKNGRLRSMCYNAQHIYKQHPFSLCHSTSSIFIIFLHLTTSIDIMRSTIFTALFLSTMSSMTLGSPINPQVLEKRSPVPQYNGFDGYYGGGGYAQSGNSGPVNGGTISNQASGPISNAGTANTASMGGTTTSGNAQGGSNGGGNAFSGNSGSAQGGGVYNSAGAGGITNGAGANTSGRGGTSTSGSATGGRGRRF